MKLIFLDPDIFTVKILRADSISSSVLNRIKRDWAGSTTKIELEDLSRFTILKSKELSK